MLKSLKNQLKRKDPIIEEVLPYINDTRNEAAMKVQMAVFSNESGNGIFNQILDEQLDEDDDSLSDSINVIDDDGRIIIYSDEDDLVISNDVDIDDNLYGGTTKHQISNAISLAYDDNIDMDIATMKKIGKILNVDIGYYLGNGDELDSEFDELKDSDTENEIEYKKSLLNDLISDDDDDDDL